MRIKRSKIKGSILIETIVATALFVTMSTVVLMQLIQSRENQYDAYLYNQGAQLAKEGIEALISIKSVSYNATSSNNTSKFDKLTAGTHYLIKNTNDDWDLTITTPDIINEKFYRTIIIEDVKRLDNGLGDIDVA